MTICQPLFNQTYWNIAAMHNKPDYLSASLNPFWLQKKSTHWLFLGLDNRYVWFLYLYPVLFYCFSLVFWLADPILIFSAIWWTLLEFRCWFDLKAIKGKVFSAKHYFIRESIEAQIQLKLILQFAIFWMRHFKIPGGSSKHKARQSRSNTTSS